MCLKYLTVRCLKVLLDIFIQNIGRHLLTSFTDLFLNIPLFQRDVQAVLSSFHPHRNTREYAKLTVLALRLRPHRNTNLGATTVS